MARSPLDWNAPGRQRDRPTRSVQSGHAVVPFQSQTGVRSVHRDLTKPDQAPLELGRERLAAGRPALLPSSASARGSASARASTRPVTSSDGVVGGQRDPRPAPFRRYAREDRRCRQSTPRRPAGWSGCTRRAARPAPMQRIGASLGLTSGRPSSAARVLNRRMSSARCRCRRATSSVKCSRADAMTAPSMGGCTGPEKTIGPPTVKTRRRVSSSGNVTTPPAAANDLFSEPATTLRDAAAGLSRSSAYPGRAGRTRRPRARRRGRATAARTARPASLSAAIGA